jgi:DNA-directed RNA polymerase subunit RPC12/RpoP
MSREIKCKLCGYKVGEIRDAKFSKGIVYLCKVCDKKRDADLAQLHRLYAMNSLLLNYCRTS